MSQHLTTIERKVLGALLIKTDKNMFVESTHKGIAQIMGYKNAGGAITFALRALEMKNYISTEDKFKYRVLL